MRSRVNSIQVQLNLQTGKSRIVKNLLFALLTTFALSVNITMVSQQKIIESTTYHSGFIYSLAKSDNKISALLSDLYLSLRYGALIISLLFFISFIYYQIVRRATTKKRSLSVLALGFSMLIMASYLGSSDTLIAVLHSARSTLKCLIALIGYTILTDQILQDMFRILGEKSFQTRGAKLVKPSRLHSKSTFLLLISGLFLICWGLYIVAHFPGVLIDDSGIQFREMVKLPIQYDEFIIRGQQLHSFYTDGNPILTTFLLKIFFDFGNIIHSQNVGIFLYILFQDICLALSMANAAWFLQKRGLNRKLITAYIIFVAAFPYFPMFATFVLPKNTLFAAVFITYLLELYKVIYEKQSLRSLRYCFQLIILMTGLILLNKTGSYIVLLSAVYIIISNAKHWKSSYFRRLVLVMLLSVALPSGITSKINTKLNIIHIKPVEMYSVFFQQTGRYVSKYEDEVTPQEKKTLNRVFDYKQISKLYSPKTADGMKDQLFRHKTVTKQDLRAYSRVWLNQFLKHPLCYVEATFDNQSQLFNLSYSTPLLYGYDFSKQVIDREFRYSGPAYYGKSRIQPAEEVKIHMPKAISSFAYTMENILKCFMRLPIVSLLCNMGIYFYIYFTLFIFAIIKKRVNYLRFISPVVVFYLIMVASPYASFRYLMPLMFAWPIYLAAYMLDNNRKIAESGDGNESTRDHSSL